MIYIRTRCPSAINVAPSSRMHFIFKEQAHPLRSTPRRCFSFLALSSFQVRCAVPTTCVIIFQHTQSYHASHAITSSLSCHPRSLRVWIHITWLFCIRMSPRCNAFCVSHHFAVLVREWYQQPLSSSDVFVPPASICFCDRSLSLPSTFHLSLKYTLRAIPAITAAIIYASHRSKPVLPVFLLCRSILHFLFYYL